MRKICLFCISLFLLICIAVSGCASKKITGSVGQTEKTLVTITDGTGKNVEIFCPVDTIVTITSGASEMIYALGGEERIIGRDSRTMFPASLTKIPEVAGTSYLPNLELIIQCKPDVVVADSMLKTEMREKLEAAGIPVIVETTSDTKRLPVIIENFGTLLGKKERARELIDYCTKYHELIKERTEKLADKDKPLVYYEWNKPYYSSSAGTTPHERIELAGGINIAADEPIKSPTLTPEWLAEKNPQFIVRMSTRGETPEQMRELRDEVMRRPGLTKTRAVKDEKVYIMSWDLTAGLRSPVGSLYWAKWLHPDLFADIDPEDVHKEMLKKFYDLEPENISTFP